MQLIASTDGLFSGQDKVTIVQGRAADPARADEVVASTRAAALLGLHVGSRVPVGIWSDVQKSTRFHARLDLKVVGIGAFNTQVLQDDIDKDQTGFLLGTPALGREFATCCSDSIYDGLRLAGGSRYDAAVEREYEHLIATSAFYGHGAARSCRSSRSTTPRSSRPRRSGRSGRRPSRSACSGSLPGSRRC